MKNPLKRSVSEDFWSEWRGSNSRPPHPKCGALSTALHPVIRFLKGILTSVGYYVVVALLYHISREKEREKSAVFKALLRGS